MLEALFDFIGALLSLLGAGWIQAV